MNLVIIKNSIKTLHVLENKIINFHSKLVDSRIQVILDFHRQ